MIDPIDLAREPEPPPPPPAAPRPQPDSGGLVTAGYVFAFLLPVVGLVIGVMLLSRSDPSGPKVTTIATVMLLIAYVLLT